MQHTRTHTRMHLMNPCCIAADTLLYIFIKKFTDLIIYYESFVRHSPALALSFIGGIAGNQNNNNNIQQDGIDQSKTAAVQQQVVLVVLDCNF